MGGRGGGGEELTWAKMSMEERIRARARLLLVVLASEVRRSCVWQNPRSVTSESSLLERPFALESSHHILHSWSTHVQTAWHLSPQLALSLYQRYPLKGVLQEVKCCASRDPSKLLAISRLPPGVDTQWRVLRESEALAVLLLASLQDSSSSSISRIPQIPQLVLCSPLPLPLALPGIIFQISDFL